MIHNAKNGKGEGKENEGVVGGSKRTREEK